VPPFRTTFFSRPLLVARKFCGGAFLAELSSMLWIPAFSQLARFVPLQFRAASGFCQGRGTEARAGLRRAAAGLAEPCSAARHSSVVPGEPAGAARHWLRLLVELRRLRLHERSEGRSPARKIRE
jgi:hypothetical protein